MTYQEALRSGDSRTLLAVLATQQNPDLSSFSMRVVNPDDTPIGAGGGGGLTDTQLRASAVPVSGSFFQATQPVSGTFWQTTQPISAASLPLPTGAATETTAAAISAKFPATLVGGRLDVNIGATITVPVSGTFWQATQPVSGSFWQATQPISAASLPLPIGAATETTIAAVSAKLPATLGQKTMSASLAVALASDQSALPTKEAAATLVGTTISGANASVTLTLTAAGAGLFHYITSIEIVALNPTAAAIAGSAVNLAYTTTNLGLAWNTGNALAAGAEKVVTRLQFGPPLRSATANTNTTIIAPAIGAGGLVRITVTYYTGA